MSRANSMALKITLTPAGGHWYCMKTMTVKVSVNYLKSTVNINNSAKSGKLSMQCKGAVK